MINVAKKQAILNEILLNEGALVDGKNLLPVSLTPYLIKYSDYINLSNMCKYIISALEKLLRLYVKDKDVQKYYPELTAYRDLSLNIPAYSNWIHLARFDIVETEEGNFKLLETNCDCPGAIILVSIIDRACSSIGMENFVGYHKPYLQPINDENYFINSLLRLYKETKGDYIPNIAFLSSQYRSITSDMDLLERVSKKIGINGIHAKVQDLAYKRGRVYAKNIAIDLAYQKFDAFIDDDMQAKPCIYEKSPEEVRAYFTGIKDKKIITVNSFPSSLIAENKRSLAYLQQDQFKKNFSDKENEAINKLIPKTYTFVKDMLQPSKYQVTEFLENKDKYVIKKVIDTRGRGVVIGKQCSLEQWRIYLNKALQEPYVIQEYAKHNKEEVYTASALPVKAEMYSNLAIFMIAGEACGLLSRASPDMVTNIGKAGCMRPVYIL